MEKSPKINIEIKPSKLHGVGIFAVKNIKKGTIIGNENGFINDKYYVWYTWRDYKKFKPEVKNKIKELCAGRLNGFYSPLDFDILPISWYSNHSCDGNLGFNANSDLIAIRNIKKGEELTFDYGLTEANPKFKMKCGCGSKNCRKVITGNDWKNPKFFKNNFKYMKPYLRNLIKI